ncbi:isochorismatase family protein [Egicoccus halophilus]|uniref:Isochorismatase n=1 Tax=Egicoccus halophilus TaxID=1670830 RepID=A0A8J3EV05_9ACTN|nr:isochorismatase family protein [Egicoccus halophilus]GGI08715.1 isochorismatase [Egicoccus halophilus]
MDTPRRALVVIDAQQQYFDGMLAVEHPPRAESIARIGEAFDTATANGIPVVVVQHELPEDAPVFAAGSDEQRLHPEIERRADHAAKRVTKVFASVFEGTGLTDWLRAEGIDTVTLTGYMTNNCVIGSAADAEPLGLTVEVLADATGAIPLANAAGSASAETVHETLMALLHSNWAAVTPTDRWLEAVEAGAALERGNLVESALAGRDGG